MSKKLLIGMAVMSLALIGSSFAAVENIKVSGDITAQAISRDLSLGGAVGTDQEDFLFSQIRLKFDTDLTENVAAVISLINERLWGTETVATTDIDLDLGYVELKEFLYGPLTLIVGRQNLRYGNALIIGDPDTNQTASGATPTQPIGTTTVPVIGDLSLRKSFDAVRANFDYSPYTLDLIYAKVTEGTTNIAEDVTLFGANLSYQWGFYNGITEVYFFGSEKSPGTTSQDVEDKVYVVGARLQCDLNDNLTLGLEGAYQFGDISTAEGLSAWAYQLITEYRFLNDYNAKIGFSYTFLSGDDSGTGDSEAWDPMFEDQTPAEILNILGSNTNAHLIRLSGSLMPKEDLTLGLIYCKSILAEKLGSFSPASGPASGNTYTVASEERDFGDEIDAYLVYDYTEDVQFKLIGAWFIPGDMFASSNDDVAYSIRGSLKVNF